MTPVHQLDSAAILDRIRSYARNQNALRLRVPPRGRRQVRFQMALASAVRLLSPDDLAGAVARLAEPMPPAAQEILYEAAHRLRENERERIERLEASERLRMIAECTSCDGATLNDYAKLNAA